MMNDNKLTLLVVDDEIINITVLLETLGTDYNVRVATDSTSALASAKDNPPDLILLDVMMPGMDGFEVCRRLKADPNTRDIPIIFLTARNEDADETLGLELGAADYITKPFNPAIVNLRVRKHVQLKIQHERLVALAVQRGDESAAINLMHQKTLSLGKKEEEVTYD